MNGPKPFSVAAVQQKREQTGQGVTAEPVARAAPLNPRPAARAPAATDPATPGESAGGISLPFDPLRLVAALVKRWPLLPLLALVLAVPAFFAGIFKFKEGYTVSVQLIRREVSTAIKTTETGEAFKPRQVTVATVVNVMQSLKLLEAIGAKAVPPMTDKGLLAALTIKPEKDTDLINVTLKVGGGVQAAADLINNYAGEVVALTAQMQADEARELNKFLIGQIAQIDADLATVNGEISEFARTADFFGADRETEAYLRQLSDIQTKLQTSRADSETLDFRITTVERELTKQNPLALKVNQARDLLAHLQASYTDNNPQVQDAKDKLAALEAEATRATAGSNNLEAFRYSENTLANNLFFQWLTLRGEKEGATKQIAQFTASHDRVKEKLSGIPEKGQRYAQIVARQQSLQAARDMLAGRQREAQMFAENSPGLYRLFARATEENVEVSSRWKKIVMVLVAAAVFGVLLGFGLVCGLELLDLRVVSAGDLKRVTRLPVVARLADTTGWSAEELSQWRFRAWAQLLRGLKWQGAAHVTLAFTSAKEGEGKSALIRHLRDAARDRSFPVVAIVNSPSGHDTVKSIPLADALADPECVARELREQPATPVELHYDRAWKWSLEQRARWQRAQEAWQAIPALALLVELPAMSDLDAVLAAELMPAVVWVAASGESQQGELAAILETVQAAEIPLRAAFLNREPAMLAKLGGLGRIGLAAALLFCALAPTANAAATNETNAIGQLSASSLTPQLAPWQEKFTVGAGDIFNLRIYGNTDTVRVRVTIGPDGRISFLEAHGVPVAGLTVDEMRAKLDEELAKHYKNARTIVTPVEWHSKQYYLLGAVVERGTYTLDRPLTIIEAVARARGIDVGLYQHNTVEIADMKRSFIVRNNKRLPVDFERLFNQGDLTQNILVEPGDYLFFPSGTINEVYLLGHVRNPGPLGLTAEKTLIGVLTVRGGFLPSAYKQRVLVVRGALEHPQTFVINVAAIFAAREKDFELQPKDIIYVAEKPWQRAEELLEMAVNSYVQAMTTTWVGINVQPLTKSPLLPQIR